MADITPVINLMGKMLKASVNAMVDTIVENEELAVEAMVASRKASLQFKAMMEDYRDHCKSEAAQLEDFVYKVESKLNPENESNSYH